MLGSSTWCKFKLISFFFIYTVFPIQIFVKSYSALADKSEFTCMYMYVVIVFIG